MAGDWIPMFHSLVDKEEVLCLHEVTGEEIATILGRFFMLWRLFDRETIPTDESQLDAFVAGWGPRVIATKCGGTSKFWTTASTVCPKWIEFVDGGTKLSRFYEHVSKTSKRRLKDAFRKTKFRGHIADKTRTHCGHIAEGHAPSQSLSQSLSTHSSNITPNTQSLGVASGKSDVVFLVSDLEPLASQIFAKTGYSGDQAHTFWQAAAFRKHELISEHDLWEPVEGTELQARQNVPAYFAKRFKQKLVQRGLDYRELLKWIKCQGGWPTGPPAKSAGRLSHQDFPTIGAMDRDDEPTLA